MEYKNLSREELLLRLEEEVSKNEKLNKDLNVLQNNKELPLTNWVDNNISSSEKNQIISLIFDQLPVAIGVKNINEDFKYSYANKQFYNFFETKQEDVLGFDDFNIFKKSDAEHIRRIDKDLLKGEQFIRFFQKYDSKSQGKRYYIRTKFILNLKDHSFLIAVIEDFTERRKKQIALEKYNEQLIRSKDDAEKSERLTAAFLANMSHEIRTPMNGIIGFSKLLSKNDLSDELRTQFSEIVSNSGKQLLNIIDAILDISSIQSGVVKIEYENMNINDSIRDAYKQFRQTCDQNQLQLSISMALEDDHANIFCDWNRLNQVINNLMSNAIKFTRTGSIEIGYTVASSNLIIYVKDTGIGMTQEEQQMIFKPFQRVDLEIGNYEGTGLGLSICKSVIEAMEGKIWVESERIVGSTFYFTIPYSRTQLSTTTEDTPLLSNITKLIQNKTILIAEDHDNSFFYIDELLGNHPMIVRAKNGQEAIDIVKSNKNIDLILMDIKMPILDGYQATKTIKEFRPEIPIVGQSAYAMLEDIEKAKDIGFNDYISKPIEIEKITKVFEKFLG